MSLHSPTQSKQAVQSDEDSWISELSPPSVETTITSLFDSESRFSPSPDYFHRCFDRSVDVTARLDSINWILKVHAFYHFKPVTALLSVNYFDRFLSSQHQPFPANGWPFQLLSVACLSLAAKMEELEVPLLLDLQVLDPVFVFEPETVQRMELLVMAYLKWRLRSVTPFDYLHYFICNLPSSSKPGISGRVFSVSSDLIIGTTRAIDFLDFAPSTIAAAAVLCAAGESVEAPASGGGVVFHERVNKEKLRSCRQLMEEYLIDTCPSPAAPPSPVGVLDAAGCRSCDTRSETTGQLSQSRAADGEPPVKRGRSSSPDGT